MVFLIILVLLLVGGVVNISWRLSWGLVKLVLGLVVFAFLPVILILALIAGVIAIAWPLLIVGGLCYLCFRKTT